MYGGERGIRTLDTLLTYTPLAGARLQPLGHFSVNFLLGRWDDSETTMPPYSSGGIISHQEKNQRPLSLESPPAGAFSAPFSI